MPSSLQCVQYPNVHRETRPWRNVMYLPCVLISTTAANALHTSLILCTYINMDTSDVKLYSSHRP